MALWRTRFKRINFGYDPVLYQISDVVFNCNITKEEADTEIGMSKLSDAAWDAVWKQNPHWEDPTGPIKEIEDGWSSVLGGYPGSKYFIVNKATEDMIEKPYPQRRRSDD